MLSRYKDWSKEELIEEISLLKKSFGIVWDRKNSREYFDEISEGKLPVLKEDKNLAIINDPDKKTNFIIEGDNYHSLSVLNYTHENSVDIIYIDPPYNTLNKGFIYNDKRVDKDDGYRHSKWLSFMEKRLKLAKNLLKDGGAIFISIDDNEESQLKLLCDEIFHDGYIQKIIWKRHSGGGNDSTYFAVDHEYILAYCKGTPKPFWMELSEEKKAEFCNIDGNYKELGPYKTKSFKRSRPDDPRPGLRYTIICPDGTELYDEWRWEEVRYKEEMEKEPNKRRIIIEKNKRGQWNVNYKIYLNDSKDDENEERMEKPRSLLLNIASNSDGKKDLKKIFGGKEVFNNPKPVDLIKYLIKITSVNNKDALILDFFAGSGTTGQAVLELNEEDGGSRSFILCSNKEDIPIPNLIRQINREYMIKFDCDKMETQIYNKLETENKLYVLLIDEPSVDKIKLIENYEVSPGQQIKFFVLLDKNVNDEEITKKTIENLVKKTNFKINTTRGRNINNNDFTLNTRFYDEEKNLCKDVCYERINKVIQGYPYDGKKQELIWSKRVGINELKKGNDIYIEYQEERKKNSVIYDDLKSEWNGNTLELYGIKNINGFTEGYNENLSYFITDFVDGTPVDSNKKKIVDKSTEMLCLKEDTFKVELDTDEIKVFQGRDRFTVIIYDEFKIYSYLDRIDGLSSIKPVSVYVFSLENDDFAEEFRDIDNVRICTIPSSILNVYRRILGGI